MTELETLSYICSSASTYSISVRGGRLFLPLRLLPRSIVMATSVDYEYQGPRYFDLTTSTTVCPDFLPDSMKGAEGSGQELATVEEIKVEMAGEQVRI